jgi:hypothetical protein
MVESLDFTLGIILGIVVTFLANYFSENLRERKRERKRHDHVVNAFIRELTTIKDNIVAGDVDKSVVVGTPVFDKLITEIPLLKEIVADELLLMYADIKFFLHISEVRLLTDRLKQLTRDIETVLSMLKREVKPIKRKGTSHDK